MMTGAWYWYVKPFNVKPGGYVKIHAEKPGYVRGRYWVIPVKDDDWQRWNIYLRPVAGATTLDCEWVFDHRVKWEPPPKVPVVYTTDICECCGQEVWL
jgi:hypothetical protein